MNSADGIEQGMAVVTNAELGDTRGMLIAQRHIDARRTLCAGNIDGFVAGHGGDVWWVIHEHGVAAYNFTEFEPLASQQELAVHLL